MIDTLLIDRRNYAERLPEILEAMRSAVFIGIDCETEDSRRHAGLNLLMKVDSDGFKAGNTKLVFDHRRTTMCGLSLYPEGWPRAYYFNLAHADVQNRLTWPEIKVILDARREDAWWLSHKAPFEITMFAACHGYELTNIICTLQLSVTAFGDDVYDLDQFRMSNLRGIYPMLEPMILAAREGGMIEDPDEDDEDIDTTSRRFPRKVEDLIGKITSKTSDAAHSYNGWVDAIAYGHGLKQLVLRIFGHQMSSFAETLGDEAHMGKLTGEQVAAYGAEDAYWVVPLARWLLDYVARNSPSALETFFSQENPMIHVYSELWSGGIRVNYPAIHNRRAAERVAFARVLRELKAALRQLPQWPGEPNPELMRREERWYGAKDGMGYVRYRHKWLAWMAMPDSVDDYQQCLQVSSPVGNAWWLEKNGGAFGKKHHADLSITHYMPIRTLYYDMMGCRLQFDMGKVVSDGEARGKIKRWLEKNDVPAKQIKLKIIDLIGEMASIEQRMKLYLTPYLFLTDPETGRLYPHVSAMLNTRRLAAESPNSGQMSKRGESTYVRGFVEGDTQDHVVVSVDWSSVELVIIGELSDDPLFHDAFGQRPYKDLHAGAATSVLQVEMPWLTEDQFKSLKSLRKLEDFYDSYGVQPTDAERLFTNLKGEPIEDCPGAYKLWRTEIGKGANFNYWFSGFLHTIGQKMGWGLNVTGAATDNYRNRFWKAEEWRLDTIDHARSFGWVELPDGHRRHKYEATWQWVDEFKAKFPRDELLDPIVHEICRRIQKRALNQCVNAVVQGTCATLMKRSTLRMRSLLRERGWTKGDIARFLIPIHDEKVYSVHHELAPSFITTLRDVMIDHPDLFRNLVLDASPAVGLTFEPWHPTKAPFGQVELAEPPAEIVGAARAGKPLDEEGYREVIQYLRHTRMAA